MKPAVTSPLPANSSSLKMPLTPQIPANNPKLAEIGTNSVATPNNLSLPASALATPSPQTAVPAAPNPLPAAPIPSEQNLSKPVDKTRTPASSPIPPSYLAPATLLEAIVPNAPASALPEDLGFDPELEVDFDELTSQSPAITRSCERNRRGNAREGDFRTPRLNVLLLQRSRTKCRNL